MSNLIRKIIKIFKLRKLNLILIFLIILLNSNLINCANLGDNNFNKNNNPQQQQQNEQSSSINNNQNNQLSLLTSSHPEVLQPPNCSDQNLIKIFESRGIKSSDIPKKSFNEMVLRYCELPAAGTCCSWNMENKLAMSSRQQLEKNLKDLISKLGSVLGTRAQKFNEFFEQLLLESKKEFHTMFKRTYGVIYEQNAYVFSDLFSELEKYYARGKVDLSEAMDSFFNTLYQKMFTVLNAQYTFDDKYLGCVAGNMKELKPFGDVPDKLSVQIKRSFVATRTFAQAVYTASDILKKIVNIRLNSDCTGALTKMQQCGVCKGHTEKPCSNYCVNVVKGCLHYFHELDAEWDNFVNAIEKISDRLLGPFNIVMVVEPINIKISEAIMNFQETGQEVSNQVFQGCGRPVLGRRKRTVNTYENTYIKENNSIESDILDIDASLENEIVLNNDRVRRSAEPAASSLKETTEEQHQVTQSSEYQNTQQEPKQQQQRERKNNNQNKRKNKKKQQNNKNENDEYTNREPFMDKLIKDIRQKVKESKKFWSNIPYQVCNNEELSATPDLDSRCWNGSSIDRYKHSIVSEHGINPEFPNIHNSNNNNQNSKNQGSTVVSNQLYFLKIAVNHLRNAYNGLDVDWSDQEETEEYENGSGSGDDGIIDVDREDDDDEEIGSGSSSKGKEDSKLDAKIPSIKETNSENDSGERIPEITIPKHSDKNRDSHNINKPSKTNESPRLKVMPLRRAILMYLFPIYLTWFGRLFSDLL